jgi:hypothetical protein
VSLQLGFLSKYSLPALAVSDLPRCSGSTREGRQGTKLERDLFDLETDGRHWK